MTGAGPSMGQAGAYGGLERVPTGIAGLDEILGGGLFRGGVYIVQGTPGSGKTIFGNQACYTHAGASPAYEDMGASPAYEDRLARHMRSGRRARAPGALRHAAGREPRADARPHRAARLLPPDLIPDRITYLSAFRTLQDGGWPAS